MPKKKINLALQGGGAHGAFIWGLLDAFLESELFIIDGISSTSAGSMNAAALAHGFIEGGEEGARKSLYTFWHTMSDYGKLMGITAKSPVDYLMSNFSKTPFNYSLFNTMLNLYSPYQLNPLNYHPLRDVLEKVIDIERIKSESKINLYVCATNVQTSKIRIFSKEELSIDTLLASACSPKFFQAVEVEGSFYWDGGFMGNPAIFPLIYNTKTRDIIVFHTIPIIRMDVPTTTDEIDSRLREISFNSSLMREMRAIAFVSRLISEKSLKEQAAKRFKKVFMHCISADNYLSGLPLSTVYSPEWDFLLNLRDMGRMEAHRWIKRNYASLGKKSTIDLDEWL